MKNIIELIFRLSFMVLLIFITGCKNASEKPESNLLEKTSLTESIMKQSKFQSFGKNYAEAWSSQKPERVAEFFTLDASLAVNNGEPAIGTEAITKVAKGFMDAFPDMIVTMDSLVAKSNKTQFYWTLIGTNTGPDGMGNKVKISGFEEWTLNKDGLIMESKGSFDEEDYYRQLRSNRTE